jgi:anhydro-N-acetylmuramic acid kinase
MVYKVIGLMSGSSLDGLDIAYVHLEEVRGSWSHTVHCAECIAYTEAWTHQLATATQQPVADFLRLHTAYGHYLGVQIREFIEKYDLVHKVDFIASHGHTVFHEPSARTGFQLGAGAAIAAETGLPVICDLRALDMAFGGQGAPIVPVGDRLLFGGYDYLLNIGGIANLTVKRDDALLAFDVCPANQILDAFARKAEQPYDADGKLAASGVLLKGVLHELNQQPYYRMPAPKSLGNEAARDMIFPHFYESEHTPEDMLHTMVLHIADQVIAAVQQHPVETEAPQMLVTGGGALNNFLVERIRAALEPSKVTVVVPDTETVLYKEAIVMALIGALRWREEVNVFSSVTGASRDSSGGALWIP